jgi:SAM-dependent methyltransferase
MAKNISNIIHQLQAEGLDYADFGNLVSKLEQNNEVFDKDELVTFLENDIRIQLHATPNNIAQFIAHLSKAYKPKSAIDLCCGTGNILYYLQNQIEDLTGVEIEENIATLTRYFIPDIKLITADTFYYPFSQHYDLVTGNIPWGIRVDFDGKIILIEEAFLRKAIELLNENGYAIFLVPYSVLVGSQYSEFRKEFQQHLVEVIGLFDKHLRYARVKIAVLILSKKATTEFRTCSLMQKESLEEQYKNTAKVEHQQNVLLERWDPDFFINQQSDFYEELNAFETKQLQDLAELIPGKYFPKESMAASGDYLYLRPVHLQNGKLEPTKSAQYISKNDLKEADRSSILLPGDIVISTIFNELKLFRYGSKNPPSIASNNLAIIRSKSSDYIQTYLQTEEGKIVFGTQAQHLRKGAVIPHLSLKNLREIKIPIIPVADLNSLGDSAIAESTEAQLQSALLQLTEYKAQLSKLENERDKNSALMTFLDNRFNRVESQLEVVNKKLDDLLSILGELKTDFEQVRALPREEEEKLFKLCQKIDSRLDAVYNREKPTIENYIQEVKRWLDLWELLDPESQKFLPIAEFIFDELSRIPEADYSPFVVQYCRTLENEILKKLFEAYHSIGLKDIDIYELTEKELKHNKTGKFAGMVKKDRSTYTMGDMNFIMSLLKYDGNTLRESKLLQHFRDFTSQYFDERIMEATFLNDLRKITNDFRNKAAHPYVLGLQIAKECQILLRKNLNLFLESLKK